MSYIERSLGSGEKLIARAHFHWWYSLKAWLALIFLGVFIIGIILTLAGLLVPIPLMALDLLTGAVQAYIFAVLATVFIGAAVGERRKPSASPESKP